MMDGRVKAIRSALDSQGHQDVAIMSYACKYASSFYSPFRDALSSHVVSGDKKTYQMDSGNGKEAELEADMDVSEGADMILIKPGIAYLDIVHRVSSRTLVPIASYQVSGEYSMIKAASKLKYIDEKKVVLETLKCFKRAGANAIITNYAKDAAKWLLEEAHHELTEY